MIKEEKDFKEEEEKLMIKEEKDFKEEEKEEEKKKKH